MKKLLSLGLAAMLAFGLATTSFAAEDKKYTKDDDMTTVSISKTYTLENAGTVSPAETFYLKQTGKAETQSGVAEKDIPDLVKLTGEGETEYVAKATFAQGDAGKDPEGTKAFELTLPKYDTVGVYEYTLQEVAGNTAGVTYRTETMKVVVTVINTDDGKIRIAGVHTEKPAKEGEEKPAKSGSFDDNKYSAGSLAVKKVVTGNLGDENKEFSVTVTFTNNTGKTIRENISYLVGETTYTITPADWTSDKTATATITLKHNQTVTFTNIPYDVTYTVEEANYTAAADGGYDAPEYTYADSNGDKKLDDKTVDTALEEVTITNNKDGSIDNGVVLNNMPYVLVLAVLAAGVAVFIIRKRRED